MREARAIATGVGDDVTDIARNANARTTTLPRAIDWAAIARWVAMIIAGGWVGYFLFTGMPQLTLQVYPRTIALHAMFAGLAAVYVVYLLAARRLPGGSPLDLPVLGFLAVYALATYASANWRTSLEPALIVGASVLVFYALADLPILTASVLRRAFMLCALALSVYALWIVGNDYADYVRLARSVEGLHAGNIFPATVPRVHGVSDHPNILAMILTLALPFFALGAWRPDAWYDRVIAIAGLLCGAMALFLTLSRGGWFGASVGVALTVAGIWISLRRYAAEQRGDARSWREYVPAGLNPTALAALAGAAALVVVGALVFISNSSSRPGWLFRSSLSPRQDAWHAGWQIFKDHPFLGAGPNMFGILYPQYARENFLVHTQHAHNGFLQFADDAGILGLIALAALAIAVAYVLIRTWLTGALEQRLLAVACAGALVGFSLHNQLDAGNIWKAPPIALAVIGAIIVRNWREATPVASPASAPEASPGDRARRYGLIAARVALLSLIALPFLAWYRIDRAHNDFSDGARLFAERKPGAIEKLQAAVDADSSLMPYQLLLGEVQATTFDGNGRADAPMIASAIAHLERAVALDPRSDIAHANLAKAYLFAGRERQAADEAQKTRFIARFHVPPVLAAAEVYEALGLTDDAVATYGQALSMDAGIADSPYWQMTDFRRQHFDEILRRSAIGVNACTEGAFLVRAHQSDASAPLGGLDEASKGCQLLAFSYPNDLVLRVAFAKILMQQGRMDEARSHLQYAIDRQPDFGPARTELGRWYQLNGDIDAARAQWVTGAQLDEAESVLLLGDSYPPGQLPAGLDDRLESLLQTTGTSVRNDAISILYYRLRYGRISPVDTMVPGDWQRAIPRLYQQMQDTLFRWRSEQYATIAQ